MAAPAAYADFGGRFLTSACCTLYGGRANIDGADFDLEPIHAAIAAAVGADNAGGYQIQSGFARADGGAIWGGGCPSISTRHRFYEALTPNGIFCNAYSNASLTRAASWWSSSGSTIWKAFLDGTAVFSGNVGFGAAQGFFARGEVGGTGKMTARFGAGSYPWQRATSKDGQGYHTIASSSVQHIPSGAWTVGSLPSPFTVTGP